MDATINQPATMNAGPLRATSYNADVSQQPPGPQQLDRRLGPIDAAAIVVSNVIGIGIFITPQIIAQAVPHPVGFLAVWLAGGLLAFTGALAYAELGTMRPRSGGEYVYLREGYGPLAAFLTGWTSFVAGFAGAIAAGALGAADYLGRFVPVARDVTPLFTVPLPGFPLVFSPRTIVALAAIFGLAFIHVRGLGPGRIVQNTLAAVKVGALALFVAIGLGFGRGSVAHLTEAPSAGTFNLPLAFIIVMFAYSGWNAASYVAEEIREPGRNVPRALGIGTAAVVLVYLGLNVLYLYAVPIGEIGTANSEIAMVAADRLLGPAAAQLLGALVVDRAARQPERHDDRRAARVLRHGARPRLLPGGGAHPPEIPHAVGVHPGAGGLELAARPDEHEGPARRVHGIRRPAVLGVRGQHDLRPAAAASRRAAPVPRLGLPGGARHLRAWCRSSSPWRPSRDGRARRSGAPSSSGWACRCTSCSSGRSAG